MKSISSVLVLVMICSAGCDSSQPPQSGNADAGGKSRSPETREQVPTPPYTIISDDRRATIKRSVDVRLAEPVTESELRAIAHDIHNARPGFDRTFIAYWLPDMVVGTGAWATTHYNPELEIRVLGMSVEQEKALRPTESDGMVIGQWRDRSQVGGFLTITRDGSTTEFVQRFTDGSELHRAVREEGLEGERRFEPTERVTGGEYYIVAADGWLEIYDDEGLIKRVEPFN